MSVLEGKLQLQCVRLGGGAHRGAQSKGMCLWWLLSHRSWQAGEMWRGRFTRIKWACLTFLICTSGSLTKTANLGVEREEAVSPNHWWQTNLKRHTLISEQGSLCSVVQAPRVAASPHACLQENTHAHMVFVCQKPIEPFGSLYFPAAFFICYSRTLASLPPTFSLSLFFCLPLSLSPSLSPARCFLPACSLFLLHVVFIQPLCCISKIYGKLDVLSLPAAMNLQSRRHVGRECFNRDVKHWRFIMNSTV